MTYLDSRGETWTDPTSLCAHRYYGGNPRASMGGHCLAVGVINRVILSFPEMYRSSPFLWMDMPERQIQNRAAAVLQRFCRDTCNCLSWEDYQKQLPYQQRVRDKRPVQGSIVTRQGAKKAALAAKKSSYAESVGSVQGTNQRMLIGLICG